MAKNSRRHGKDNEYELGIIRGLRKEIKNLKQRIRQLEKLEYNYIQSKQPKDYSEFYKEEPKTKANICPNCKEEYLESRIVAGRAFDSCPGCKYRTAAKRISNV